MKRLILMLLFGIVLAGCSSPTSELTADDLIGVWKNTNGNLYFEMDGDGNARIATSENIAESTVVTMEFWIEDEQYFLKDYICGDTIGQYDVEMVEKGKINFTVIEDDCSMRVNGMAQYEEMERVK